MHYLYGTRAGTDRKLVATFDSEPQLLAYVRWATLREQPYKFEQGSGLVGFTGYEHSPTPLTSEDPASVEHNPTPSML